MFKKRKITLNYITNKNKYLNLLNSSSLDHTFLFQIKKWNKNFSFDESWEIHKSNVLWLWINDNISITEKFITNFKRNVKKLGIELTEKEKTFLFKIEELYFNSWRPLKEIPVKFKLEKKEKVLFLEKNVNIYKKFFDSKINKEKFKMQKHGILFYSNKNVYLCNEFQDVIDKKELKKIKSVKISDLGTVFLNEKEEYLIRENNIFLPYIIFQRICPNLELNINKIPNLYDYFDFWNKVIYKFS